MKCRVCKSNCKMFLDLGRQPIANNFLTPESFNDEWFYDLQVYFCPECFAVQIGECPDSSEVFNRDYTFFTGSSEYMKRHFANLACLIKKKYMPKNGCIMEIGSNDGTFLEYFIKNVHLGFDPSESVNEVARSRGIRVYPYPFENFGQVAGAWPKTDVLLSANSFAHIPNRRGVLEGIKRMLAQDGVWIDEEPYLGNIFSNLAYDQFYNEHTFYSSIVSMQKALNMFGLEIIDFEYVWTHGGSIRYFVGHKRPGLNKKVQAAIQNEGLDNFDVFKSFGHMVKFSAKRFKQKLVDLDQPCVGYGATAKSTTILNFCDIGPELVKKIYDTTPSKQGKFSPGAHIPIVSYAEFKYNDSENVILFAWNHMKEVFVKESNIDINWILPH